MNNIVICGRLTKDIELKEKNDNKYCHFSIADNQSKDECIFWDCTAFGILAENLSKFRKKGDHITFFGKMTKKDDKSSLIADKIYFN